MQADESWLGMVENPLIWRCFIIYQENSKSMLLENNIFETWIIRFPFLFWTLTEKQASDFNVSQQISARFMYKILLYWAKKNIETTWVNCTANIQVSYLFTLRKILEWNLFQWLKFLM